MDDSIPIAPYERELLRSMDVIADPVPTSITAENVSDRRYTGGDTLDEPVSVTILNDVKAIGSKLRFVLWPQGDAHIRECPSLVFVSGSTIDSV